MKNLIFSLFVLLLVGSGQAQSIGELHQLMIAEHPELQSLKKAYDASTWQNKQVQRLPDPQLGVGLFPMPIETRLGPQVARFSINQSLPWAGTYQQKINIKQAQSALQETHIGIRTNELTYELNDTGLQLYELQHSQSIIEHHMTLLHSLKRLALSKVEIGQASAVDVLQVELKIKEQEQRLIRTKQQQQTQVIRLNQLLNRSSETAIYITDSLTATMINIPVHKLRAAVHDQHPMLRSIQQQQGVWQEALIMNDIERKPKVSFGIDYIFVDEQTLATPPDNGRNVMQVRAMVSIPINQQSYDAKAQEQMLKIAALDDKKQAIKNTLTAGLEQALVRYKTAQLDLEFYRSQTQLLDVAIEMQTADYRNDSKALEELLRLQIQGLQYELKELKSLIMGLKALNRIDRNLAD